MMSNELVQTDNKYQLVMHWIKSHSTFLILILYTYYLTLFHMDFFGLEINSMKGNILVIIFSWFCLGLLSLDEFTQRFSLSNNQRTVIIATFFVIFVGLTRYTFCVDNWEYNDYFRFFYYIGDERGHWFWGGFIDAEHYYVPYVHSFAFENWNPYSGSWNVDSGNPYVYGPLYIFLISVGALFFSVYNSFFYSNLLFEGLSGAFIYLILKEYTSEKRAILGVLLFTFAPMNIYYAGFQVLNTPQQSFFALSGIYAFIKKKDTTSNVLLAMGFLTKQFPLLLLGPIWILLFWRYQLKAIKYPFISIITTLFFSWPWMLINGMTYWKRLFLAGRGQTYYGLPKQNISMNLFHSSYFHGFEGLSQELFVAVNNQDLFLLALGVSALICVVAGNRLIDNPRLLMNYFLWYNLITHATIARGVYKYYDAYLTPFFLLWLVAIKIDYPELGKKQIFFRRSLDFFACTVAFFMVNAIIMNCNRHDHPLVLFVMAITMLLVIYPELPFVSLTLFYSEKLIITFQTGSAQLFTKNLISSVVDNFKSALNKIGLFRN